MSRDNNKHAINNYITSSRAAQLSGYSQDYVGQLCRNSRIDCKRVSGEWQVSLTSLLAYKKRFNPDMAPVSVVNINTDCDTSHAVSTNASADISNSHQDSIIEEGQIFLSSADASKQTGYSQDYIGQLARSGAVEAKKVGRRWFIEQTSLKQHKSHNDGLLAALQANSTGAHNQSVTPTKHTIRAPIKDSGRKIPIVTYHREDGTLMPATINANNTKSRANVSQDIRQTDSINDLRLSTQSRYKNKAITPISRPINPEILSKKSIKKINSTSNKVQSMVSSILIVTSVIVITAAIFIPNVLRTTALNAAEGLGIDTQAFSGLHQSDTGVRGMLWGLTSSQSYYSKDNSSI